MENVVCPQIVLSKSEDIPLTMVSLLQILWIQRYSLTLRYRQTSVSSVINRNIERMIQSTKSGRQLIKEFQKKSVATKRLKCQQMHEDGHLSTYYQVLSWKLNFMEMSASPKSQIVRTCPKRVESRLQRLKDSNKGRQLSDGKEISCQGRFTYAVIDLLQNQYGIAIAENLANVVDMAKAIKDSLFYVVSAKTNTHIIFALKDKTVGMVTKEIPTHANFRVAGADPGGVMCVKSHRQDFINYVRMQF